MAIDNKSYVGEQISSPQKNIHESSIVNPDGSVVVPILDYENFGQNTRISGKVGEILEAHNCDTSKDLGRISTSDIIDIEDDSDYGDIVYIKSTDMLDVNKSIQTLSVYGVHALGGTDVDNVSRLTIDIPSLSANGVYSILKTPLFIPWKIYQESDSKAYIGIGPILIQYAKDLNQSKAGSARVEDAITINGEIGITGSVIDYGSTEFDYPLTAGLPSIPMEIDVSDHTDNVLRGLKVTSLTGPGKLRIVALYDEDKYETLDNIDDVTVDNILTGSTFPIEVVTSSNAIFSLVVSYEVGGIVYYPEFNNVDYYDGDDDFRVNNSNIIPFRAHSGHVPSVGAVKAFTMNTGSIPAGVGFTIEISGESLTFFSGDSEIGTADNDGMQMDALLARDITGETVIDPLLQFDPSDSIAIHGGSVCAEIETFDVNNTEDVTIAIDVNNIERTVLGREGSDSIVNSGTGLGYITSVSDATSSFKEYVVEDVSNRDNDYADLSNSTNAYYKKIYKLSNKYMLTYVKSRFSNTEDSIDRYRFFGIYDLETDKHYSPRNMLKLIEHSLPHQSDMHIKEVNVITDDRSTIGVVVRYLNYNQEDKYLYLSVMRASAFNGSSLLRSKTYSDNIIYECIPLEDGEMIHGDKDFNIALQLSGNVPLFKSSSVNKDFGIVCGTADIAYEKPGKTTSVSFNGGYPVLSHSERYVNKNVSLIKDVALLTGSTKSFPLLLPQAIVLPISDDTIDNSTSFDGDMNSPSIDKSKLSYYLKQVMGYNFKRESGDVGAFKRYNTKLYPSTGTAIICRTPSIDEQGDYNTLPLKAIETLGIDPTLDSFRVGSEFISIGGLDLAQSSGSLYKASAFKLVPSDSKSIIDTVGEINTNGNIICVSTDLATHVYAVDRSGNANYVLSIPDVILSNIISIGRNLVLAGKDGIYLLTENSYIKIYDINNTVEYAVIKPLGGNAYTVCYKEVSGEFQFYSINMLGHVTKLDYTASMENYKIVRGTKGITDKLVLLNTIYDQPTRIVATGSTGSNSTFKSRPFSITNQNGMELLVSRVYFYYKGYGEISFRIGSSGYGINLPYLCITDVPYLCVGDVEYAVTGSGDPIGEGSDSDAIQKSYRDISPVLASYLELEVTMENTISIDRIELEGIYTRR